MPVMGKWSRDELEAAFDSYQRTAMQAGMTGDWDSWADMFTEDATYIEHHYGTLGGREAIRRWIKETMSTWPGDQMIPAAAGPECEQSDDRSTPARRLR